MSTRCSRSLESYTLEYRTEVLYNATQPWTPNLTRLCTLHYLRTRLVTSQKDSAMYPAMQQLTSNSLVFFHPLPVPSLQVDFPLQMQLVHPE
jgi:hypothetical protein